MSRSTAALSVALLLTASACANGSSEPTTTGSTPGTVPGTQPDSVPATGPESVPDETLPPVPSVTFLSEPVDAGPFLGSGAADTDEDAAAPEPCLDDEEICEDLDDVRDPDALPPPDVDPFKPAQADAPFCTLLFELEDRPFPSDEFEALLVTQAWFAELAPTVPPSQQADFGVLSDWLDMAVASQGQMNFDELGQEIEDAADRVGEFVDTNCYGYGVPVVDPPPPPSTAVPSTDVPTTDQQQQPPTTSDSPTEPAGPLFGEEAQRLAEDDPDQLFPNGFEPAVDDAAFCGLLFDMAERPFPTDEIEQVDVALGWLHELSPLVPDELVVQFALFVSFIEAFAESNLDDVELAEESFDDAIDDINRFVDGNCYGL